MLTAFTGFRGRATLLQLGKVKFIVLAKNDRHLEAIQKFIMPAVTFNPAACKPSIVIQSNILPNQKTKHETHQETPA